MAFDATDFQAPTVFKVRKPSADPKENIRAVRDLIAIMDSSRFRMDYWVAWNDDVSRDIDISDLAHTCETAGCIGGWTDAIFGNRSMGMESAMATLGLSVAESKILFTPSIARGDGVDWIGGDITQAEAVMVLDHLLETGEVSWAPVVDAREAANAVR